MPIHALFEVAPQSGFELFGVGLRRSFMPIHTPFEVAPQGGFESLDVSFRRERSDGAADGSRDRFGVRPLDPRRLQVLGGVEDVEVIDGHGRISTRLLLDAARSPVVAGSLG